MRIWFAPDVGDALAELASTLGPDLDTPLLAIDWPPGTDPGAAIDRIVEALAGVAAARWPDWYGERAPFAHPDMGEGVDSDYDDRVIDRLGAAHASLNRAWAKRAIRRCRRGQRPVLNAFPPAVQVPQLMLALAQPDLILLLALEATDAQPAELLGFAQTAAWAAGETGARAAAFVPAAYCESPELDAISYGAVSWARADDSPSPHASPREDPGVATQDTDSAGSPDTTRVPPGLRNAGTQHAALPDRETRKPAPRPLNDEPLRLVHPPIIGQPHPASPGEQLLARWLARDAELAPLFDFNQPVETTSGETFITDLLWREGKMAVEVDGYTWHSGPHAFAADRYRDYRLLCDGYRTLRLPHDEVMDDPALQCEKIRDVVRAIRKERFTDG